MSDYLPGSLTTVLQAVNELIGTLGEAPVDSLSAPSSDVQIALSQLRSAELAVQSKGWFWNRLYGFTIVPDDQGHINLPDQTLSVSKAYLHHGGTCTISMRGSRAWDPLTNSDVFTYPLSLDLIVRSPWEDIPEAFRQWITLWGCIKFHARMQERSILLQVASKDVSDAMVTCEHLEDAASQNNAIYGNIGTFTSLYGYGGLRRNRGGLS